MEDVRVTKRMSLDNPPKPYWIIEEIVTPQGHYIQWPGSYSSEEAATKALNSSS